MSTPARPRIVHLTTVHPRHDIRIFRKECVSLARAGYEVVQVVGDGQGDAQEEGVRIVDLGARPGSRLARMRSIKSLANCEAVILYFKALCSLIALVMSRVEPIKPRESNTKLTNISIMVVPLWPAENLQGRMLVKGKRCADMLFKVSRVGRL